MPIDGVVVVGVVVRCIAAKRGFARVSPSDGDPVLVGASASILLFTRVASRSDTAVPALDVVSSPPRRVWPPSAAARVRISSRSFVPSSMVSSAAKTSRPESASSRSSASLAARLASPRETPSSPTWSSRRVPRSPPRVPRVPSTPPLVTARADAAARSSARLSVADASSSASWAPSASF